MLSYCLKCKINTENINLKVSKSSNGKTMMLSKCAICGAIPEASGILSSVGIRTLYILISCFQCNSSENYKMNIITEKFLLAGDRFMPEMHLKQPGFTYTACGPKIKKEFKNLKKHEIQDIFTEMN